MAGPNKVKEFREYLRHFEREIDTRNNSGCCGGVTLSQCHTLIELYKGDGVTLKELSGKMYLDKSTLSRIIESLVNLGLVDRKTPKSNRRTITINLTKQGVSVCKRIDTENNIYFRKILNSLGKKQLIVFLDSFKTVVTKMIEENRSNIKCE